MQRSVALPRLNLGRITWNQDVVDVVVAFGLALATLAAAWQHPDRLDPIAVTLLLSQSLPVAVRRRSPMRVLVVTGFSIVLYSQLGYPNVNSWPGVFLAFYTVAAQEPRIRAVISAGVTTVGILVSFIGYTHQEPNANPGDIATTYVVFALAWLIGDNLRVRRAYTKQLEERAYELERDKQQQADHAVSEERSRIARELHDVVAHYVSVMVVQSAGARRIAEKDPAAARTALEAVEAAGRTALAEMRRMLEVLRADDPGLGPQPGLDDIDKLIGHVRDAGLPVEITVQGETCCLPAGMDLAAYRLIQEALTNTVKHGGKATARVNIRYLPDTLEIEIVDDGRGAAAPLISGSGGGHGLIGMQERVSLFGGTLQVGPVLTGGYRVFARMPIEPDDSARARTERATSLAALQESDARADSESTPSSKLPVHFGRHYQTEPAKARKPDPPQSEQRHLPPLIVRVVPPRPSQKRSARPERGDQ